MIVAFYSNGQIQLNEISVECKKSKWTPIAVLRCADGSIVVPTFIHESTVKDFSRRNFPKVWLIGAILLSENDINFIKKKCWKFMVLNYPRLFTNHPEYKLDFEIIDFDDEPSLVYS